MWLAFFNGMCSAIFTFFALFIYPDRNISFLINSYCYRMLKNINLFKAHVPFLYPLKTSENKGFLTFSGGIEKEHWSKMDSNKWEQRCKISWLLIITTNFTLSKRIWTSGLQNSDESLILLRGLGPKCFSTLPMP